jgi:outer membrane protein
LHLESMLKTRILLIAVCAIVIWLIFLLPKVVVDNESTMASSPTDSVGQTTPHAEPPQEVVSGIRALRRESEGSTANEKNAIFADSLAELYQLAGNFDSAAWFAEEASKFFNTEESWTKVGDQYYQAYTLSVDPTKQNRFAEKAREFYTKVLESNPGNLDVKTKMAMTYLSAENPMQGITMLREVLAVDPKNELALLNMGMLSIQSGQHERAVTRLNELVKINPNHIQGRLLLGIALMNSGDRQGAKEQFEKVKQLDNDPAVQATVESYLKDLK